MAAEDVKQTIKDEGGIFGIADTLKRKWGEWKTYRETETPPEDWDYQLSIGEQEDTEPKIAGIIPKSTFTILIILILIIVLIIGIYKYRQKKKK